MFDTVPPTNLNHGDTCCLLGNAVPRLSPLSNTVTELIFPTLLEQATIVAIEHAWAQQSAGGGVERVPPMWVWAPIPEFAQAISQRFSCPIITADEARAAWVFARDEERRVKG